MTYKPDIYNLRIRTFHLSHESSLLTSGFTLQKEICWYCYIIWLMFNTYGALCSLWWRSAVYNFEFKTRSINYLILRFELNTLDLMEKYLTLWNLIWIFVVKEIEDCSVKLLLFQYVENHSNIKQNNIGAVVGTSMDGAAKKTCTQIVFGEKSWNKTIPWSWSLILH